MTETRETVQVFALASPEMQRELRRQLAPLGVTLIFIERAAELSYITRGQASYHVALLPAALLDADWWALWGSISLLNPRPAFLVYAHTANFQLWSGVLGASGDMTSSWNRSQTGRSRVRYSGQPQASRSGARARWAMNDFSDRGIASERQRCFKKS